MRIPKDEAIKVRVPVAIKAQLQAIADHDLSSVSDVARKAILEYLARHPAEETPPLRYPSVAPQMNDQLQDVPNMRKKKKP